MFLFQALSGCSSVMFEATLLHVNMALKSVLKMLESQLSRFLLLSHGSRKPTETPIWVTLEIKREGLVTSGYAALLSDPGDAAMQQAMFQSGDGFSMMQMLLSDGNYAVTFPEHAAMLVAAWLLEQGREDEVTKLLEELLPFVNTLKFTPNITNAPSSLQMDVAAVRDWQYAKSQLEFVSIIGAVRAQRDSVRTCRGNVEMLELQSAAVTLLCSTLGDGRLPVQGVAQRNDIPSDCAFPFVRSFDNAASIAEARRLVSGYDALIAEHQGLISQRHKRTSGSTAMLVRALQLLLELTAAESDDVRQEVVGKLARMTTHIREVMAAVLTQRSFSGSAENAAFMAHVDASTPRYYDAHLVPVLLSRLAAIARAKGISVLRGATISPQEHRELLQPLTVSEAEQYAVPQHAQFPESCVKVLNTAVEGTLDELEQCGALVSAETLGFAALALVAKAESAVFSDPRLQRLHFQLISSFHRRCSLILGTSATVWQRLVRFDELPWATPLIAELSRCHAACRGPSGYRLELACTLLRKLAELFPATLMPNQLVQALSSVLPSRDDESGVSEVQSEKCASLTSAVLEDLAADIFDFSPKFLRMATAAATLMQRTTYARYYGLDDTYAEIGAIHNFEVAATTQVLYQHAVKLAAQLYGAEFAPHVHRRSVSGIGKVIEAAQIITTHNLLLLVTVFADAPLPAEWWEATCRSAWRSYRQLCISTNFRTQSQHARQKAIAWRHVVFYLSQLGEDTQRSIVAAMETSSHTARLPARAVDELVAAVAGLRAALDGVVVPSRAVLSWVGGI